MGWIYLGQPFEQSPEGAFGFVYQISHLPTGKAYIGKKQFNSYTTKKRKGKRNQKVTKESSWRDYWSSCKELQQAVIGREDEYKREVLTICFTKGELSYAEVSEQIKRDVLTATLPDGTPAYYNGNIMNRWFRRS